MALLGKLPQSAVRTHYLQRVAERLSGGQGRLALQLEEDLRQQVKGQRWHGRSSRHEQPGEISQRERSEADLLRFVPPLPAPSGCDSPGVASAGVGGFRHSSTTASFGLPLPSSRKRISGWVDWRRLAVRDDPGDGLDDLDLPRLLTDQLLLENSALVSRLTPLLEPGELQRVSLAEPLELSPGHRSAVGAPEKFEALPPPLGGMGWAAVANAGVVYRCADRSDPAGHRTPRRYTDMETRIQALFDDLNRDALRYQELYYTERKHISHLE